MSVETLIDAFAQELGLDISADQRFGNPTAGACDGVQGVQWNTWISSGDDAAYFGVNLEGMKYDGWPVARFIEREFRHARLFEVRDRCSHPELVQVIWHRVAWQGASSPAIQEHEIGISEQMLSNVTPEAWHDTLMEAYACLDASKGHRGRGTQMVTVKRGRVEHPVSPQLQFRRRIGDTEVRDWGPVMRAARAALTPLYEYVVERASP